MSAEKNEDTGNDANASWLVSTWRTVQKADADAWRKLRDDAPFRFTRWFVSLTVVSIAWYVMGIPNRASAWLPVLGIIALLILPDASSIAFGPFAFKARQAAAEAEAASKEAQHVAQIFIVAAGTGAAAGDSAQARDAPVQPASAVSGFVR